MSNITSIMLRLNEEETKELVELMNYLHESVKTKAIIKVFKQYIENDKYIKEIEDKLRTANDTIEHRKITNDNFINSLHEMMKIKEFDS